MIEWLKQGIYLLQIKVLLLVSPATFFNKINQLDWYRNMLHEWINRLDLNPNSSILEAGCETGSLCVFLDNSNFIPTGIDASNAMIQRAKNLNEDLEFHVANIYSLPFGNETFEAVVSASLINIVDDQKRAINEMLRVCKKGGTISLLVPKEGFADDELESLFSGLDGSNFSKEALRAWHKLAPKMSAAKLEELLVETDIILNDSESYLQGMVLSVSGVKS